MKHLSLILTTLLLFWNNPVLALGLGTPSSQAVLGERLYIEIPVIGIGNLTDDEIKIAIADKAAYEKMDIDLQAVHQTFEFAIKRDAEKVTLVITSPKNINEPFLHFVLKIVSPTGTVLKDVSVLLDAPQ